MLLLGIYLEKTLIWKDPCTPMFTAASFTVAKIWNHLKCPSTDKWIKMWYIYIYMKQEVDGYQDRHLQLASCLYFLRQERGGLQDKHLQRVTYLYFKIETSWIQAQGKWLVLVFCELVKQWKWQDQKRAKPCLGKRPRGHKLPTLGVRETPTTRVQRDPSGSGREGPPGHNKSRQPSHHALLWIPSWPKNAQADRGGSWVWSGVKDTTR